MGDVKFDLFGRGSAQISEASAERVSRWSLDLSEEYKSIRRKIHAAIASEAFLDVGEAEELLSILDAMEAAEKPKQLPLDLVELQAAARKALT